MTGAAPDRVRIVEVGPRDGLQNEHGTVPVDVRVDFIERLVTAGLTEIEVGAFVRPEWVPQMADTDEVVHRLLPAPGVTYSALVPNEKGMLRAMASGLRSVAVFTAASETFNLKNTNAGIEESLERFRPVLELARGERIRVRGYVSTAFACPYEGPIAPAQAVAVSRRLLELGVDEVSVGDTIGMATPRDVRAFIAAADGCLDRAKLAFHFHDTRGTALANVLTAIEDGFAVFDASAGGLGGCPYAPGASGNLATEDLVFMLAGMGIATGVDLDLLAAASSTIERILDHPLPSKTYQALRACQA